MRTWIWIGIAIGLCTLVGCAGQGSSHTDTVDAVSDPSDQRSGPDLTSAAPDRIDAAAPPLPDANAGDTPQRPELLDSLGADLSPIQPDLEDTVGPTPGDTVAAETGSGDTTDPASDLSDDDSLDSGAETLAGDLPRRTYSVGFILLVPEGSDLQSKAVTEQLAKLEAIKSQLVTYFDIATDGTGAVDVSYPVVTLAPPDAVGQETSALAMWDFLQDLVQNTFYAKHPDQFDFLAVYEAYPDKTLASRHRTIKRVVAGFGMTPFDNAAKWGSSRLRGIGLITDITQLPKSFDFLDSKMHLLLHELFGHQWGVYAPALSKLGSHFDIGVQSPAHSVLYARPWRQDDETHFHTEAVLDPASGAPKVVFHPWMLYVAGLKTRDEVPQAILKVIPDKEPENRYHLYSTTGTATLLTLQSVIDQSGDRYDVP